MPRNIFVMRYNIFVNIVFPIILALFAVSCVPKIDIDDPAGRNVSVAPTGDSGMTLQLVCNSNVNDYVKVMFHYRDHRGIHTRGDFSARNPGAYNIKDTIMVSWPAEAGQIQIAFRAVKLRNTLLPVVYTREDGITFNVEATLRTPTDGAKVNWSGMFDVPLSNASQFWSRTYDAVNTGLLGETPGTGTDRYLNFMVDEDAYGPYGIKIDWKRGNLFEND